MITEISYLFYILPSQDTRNININLDGCYSLELLKPTTFKMLFKPGLNGKIRLSLYIWSILHYFKLFRNSHYSVFLVHQGKQIIHYSVVLPGFFKLPFMAKRDLNIGPCWTHPEYRGMGIASHVIHKIFETYKEKGRIFWYFTRQENLHSKRLAERNGFILYGEGIRKKRFGIKFLGGFAIQKVYL